MAAATPASLTSLAAFSNELQSTHGLWEQRQSAWENQHEESMRQEACIVASNIAQN